MFNKANNIVVIKPLGSSSPNHESLISLMIYELHELSKMINITIELRTELIN